MDLPKRDRLRQLVFELTSTGHVTLDDTKFTELKKICKSGDEYVAAAYDFLLERLKFEQSQVRFSAVQVMDALFTRSHLFRTKLLDDFTEFIDLTCGLDIDKEPLPKPAATAKLLRRLALLRVHHWHGKFGQSYRKLALGYEWLKSTWRINFDDVEAVDEEESRRQRATQERERIRTAHRYLETKVDMGALRHDMQSTLAQLNNSFALVVPDMRVEETVGASGAAAEDASEATEIIGDAAKELGLGGRNYELTVSVSDISTDVTENNRDVLQTIVENARVAEQTHLPRVNEWLDVLLKYEPEPQETVDVSCRIKECFELKNQLTEAVRRANELNIDAKRVRESISGQGTDAKRPPESDDDEDFGDGGGDSEDEFEDTVYKEGLEVDVKAQQEKQREQHRRAVNAHAAAAAADTNGASSTVEAAAAAEAKRAEQWNLFGYSRSLDDRNRAQDPTARPLLDEEAKKLHEEQSKKGLIEGVPVVSWGFDLAYWGVKDLPLRRANGFDDLNHRFWTSTGDLLDQRVDISELTSRVITVETPFKPVERACRAPLPNGKLCTRHDRVKCPFHGVIVPRDDKGNPVDTDSKSAEAEAAAGKDEKPARKKRRTAESTSNLVDVRKDEDSARERLRRKLDKRRGAVGAALAKLEADEMKQHADRFGNQWQYY